MRKTFAVSVVIIMLLLLLHSPVAKAQETVTKSYDANFPAQTVPNTKEVVENNIAETDSIKTEIGIWENDLGKETTDGSYVGALFEPSTFELDYVPKSLNDITTVKYTYNKIPYPNLIRRNQQFFWDSTNETYGWQPYPDFTEAVHSNIQDSMSLSYATQRSIISLSQVVNFTNRMIMSGSCEMWVKIPITHDSIDFEMTRPNLLFFKINELTDTIDNNIVNNLLTCDARFETIYDCYPYRWAVNESGYEYDIPQLPETKRDDLSSGLPLSAFYDSQLPFITQPVYKENIINNGIYVKVNGNIVPNQNYLIVFTCVLSNKKPVVYVTEEDICSNGRKSHVVFYDVKQELGNDGAGRWEYTAQHSDHIIKRTYISNTSIPNGIHMPMDLAFSFVFKAGVGENNMFGRKIHFEKNEGFLFYNKLAKPSTDKFISVLIPFISEQDIRISITVTLLNKTVRYEPQGCMDLEPVFNFTYKNCFIWQSEKNESYGDYILFTTPYKVSSGTILTSYFYVKVLICFEEPADVTFMFSDVEPYKLATESVQDHPASLSQELRGGTVEDMVFPSFYNKLNCFYVYRNIIEIDNVAPTSIYENQFLYGIHELGEDYLYGQTSSNYTGTIKYPKNLMDSEIYHFGLFRSVQLTDGIWHQLVTTSDGIQYATKYFERRIAIGFVSLWVDTTNNESGVEEGFWNSVAQTWSQAINQFSEGDILGGIKTLISGAISRIWNGLTSFFGAISGVFTKIWDTLVKFGNFIKTSLVSFVGKILSIIDDIVNNLEKILNPFLYIIALLIFMFVISWSGKFVFPTGGM